MYFVCNEDTISEGVSNITPIILPSGVNTQPQMSNGNNNFGKRVYGRARASLSFSSFNIFCEDFSKPLEYLYAHESESYRKNILSYMWKHLNPRDKHKYYETATKARIMYNLPENLYSSENDQEKSTKSPILISRNSPEITNSSASKVVGKLVSIKFLKSCPNPIITPLKVLDATAVDHRADPKREERGRPQDEVHGSGGPELWQDHGEISEHQDHCAQHVQPGVDHGDGQGVDGQPRRWLSGDGGGPISASGGSAASPAVTSTPPLTSTARQQHLNRHHRLQQQQLLFSAGSAGAITPEPAAQSTIDIMLQQYQQQPDYTPYGGIGYGAQPNGGYFNYAASESWYGSPQGGDHVAQMHSGLSHNACTTHIGGDSAGNFLNHGYHQTSSTGAASSSVESFAANSHPVPQTDMDPMADFLDHQNMNDNNKIKEEPIDWLSTIINDDRRQDGGDNGGGGVSGGGGGSGDGEGSGGADGDCGHAIAAVSATATAAAVTGDLPPRNNKGGQEQPNGRLPNFHQAFGSTEIGRFSQHEYYEPPPQPPCKDASSMGGDGQQSSQQGPSGGGRGSVGSGAQQPDDRAAAAQTFEPPRQQNRRGRTQRGGGQHRRNKQTTRTAAAAAAQQYVGYDVSGGGGRHQVPPYHDPYGRNPHAHQHRYQHEYQHHQHHLQQQQQQQQQQPQLQQQHHHHHLQQQQHQQPGTPYQQEYYPRQYADRVHHYQQQQQQQQQQQAGPSPNQYYNGRAEHQYAAGYNRFHSCCSTEHIARPGGHHNYGGGGGGGPGQYYGDYNAYNQW